MIFAGPFCWWPGGGTRVAPAYGVVLSGHTRWGDVSAAAGNTIAGIVAAIFPARRAARLDVLQALQYE